MTERPILFSAPMVRAILAGTKTQTRRVLKLQPTHFNPAGVPRRAKPEGPSTVITCPFGQPGDQLWVRERFCPIFPQDPQYNGGRPIEYDYAATYKHGHRLGDLIGEKKKWSPSIHMPRAASRITLEITGVRVERLQDMEGQSPYPGESDALAEGVNRIHHGRGDYYFSSFRNEPHPKNWCDPVDAFRELWESINGAGSWDVNPWVWVVEFKRLEGGAESHVYVSALMAAS